MSVPANAKVQSSVFWKPVIWMQPTLQQWHSHVHGRVYHVRRHFLRHRLLLFPKGLQSGFSLW